MRSYRKPQASCDVVFNENVNAVSIAPQTEKVLLRKLLSSAILKFTLPFFLSVTRLEQSLRFVGSHLAFFFDFHFNLAQSAQLKCRMAVTAKFWIAVKIWVLSRPKFWH